MKVLHYVALLIIFFKTSFQEQVNPKIVRQKFDISPDGKYVFGFETENQIFFEEHGFLKDENLIKEGQYQYTSPDGEVIKTIYSADETGFHPQGSHLPTAPPLPPASFSFSYLDQ